MKRSRWVARVELWCAAEHLSHWIGAIYGKCHYIVGNLSRVFVSLLPLRTYIAVASKIMAGRMRTRTLLLLGVKNLAVAGYLFLQQTVYGRWRIKDFEPQQPEASGDGAKSGFSPLSINTIVYGVPYGLLHRDHGVDIERHPVLLGIHESFYYRCILVSINNTTVIGLRSCECRGEYIVNDVHAQHCRVCKQIDSSLQ